MGYEEMLKRAMNKLPKKIETKERFEIPQVVCEVAGNKSILKNFGEILTVLRRDANHLCKFISRELATSCVLQGSNLVLQGKVSKEILQKKIEDYTKEFVFCKECKKPDTRLVKEGRINFIKCEACGAKYPVRSI